MTAVSNWTDTRGQWKAEDHHQVIILFLTSHGMSFSHSYNYLQTLRPGLDQLTAWVADLFLIQPLPRKGITLLRITPHLLHTCKKITGSRVALCCTRLLSKSPYRLRFCCLTVQWEVWGDIRTSGSRILLISKWDPQVTSETVAHWLDLINVEGWIPCEQILGNEALNKVWSWWSSTLKMQTYLHSF